MFRYRETCRSRSERRHSPQPPFHEPDARPIVGREGNEISQPATEPRGGDGAGRNIFGQDSQREREDKARQETPFERQTEPATEVKVQRAANQKEQANAIRSQPLPTAESGLASNET